MELKHASRKYVLELRCLRRVYVEENARHDTL